ncbi:MAG: O-antigen ligase family protein [Elusimicrobia bacterium]|nr:O-antigen ligase family protein [Elusimicrobiota bacterium]
MVIKSFLTIILIISPLFHASWDLWAQTIIHLLTLITFLILIFSKKEVKLPSNTSLYFPLFLFLFFCLISVFNSINIYESKNGFLNILNYMAIFYLARSVDKKYILIPVLISGIFLSFYGFYQKIFFGGNISSLMNNPNIFAGYLVGIICLNMGFAFSRENKQIFVCNNMNIICKKNIHIGLVFILIVALLLTGSVSAFLSLIFGIMVYWYLKIIYIPKKYIFLAGIIFLCFFIIKILEPESFNRVLWWLAAVKMILSKPITGIGIGAFADAYQKYKLSGLNSTYAHNYFLQIAAEVGIIGFSMFVWFFLKLFKQKRTIENIPFFIAIVTMLFHGLFDYALLISANALFFWVLLGFVSKNDEKSIIPISGNQEIILKWISCFVIIAILCLSINIFLGNRETAIGKYHFDKKEYGVAQMHLEKALQYDNNNSQTYYYLSSVYQQYYEISQYQTYLDEAEIELKKAIKLQKNNSQFYFDLYNIYYRKGDIKNALYWMKKAYKSSPIPFYNEKNYYNMLKRIY